MMPATSSVARLRSPASRRLGRVLPCLLALAFASLLAACSGDGQSDAAAGAAAEDTGETIIVSGASGRLGSQVVEELLARGVAPENLILVSRTPEEQSAYAALGAATRFGDYTQPESLEAAYAGGTKMLLISMNSGPDNRPELHNNAIQAAVNAGVRHIAYTSSVDVDNFAPDARSARDHRGTEEYLRASGVAWTMLRHQLYMDGVVNQAARMVEAGTVEVMPDEVPTAYVARTDCAAAAAAVLTTPGHENQAYDITGPSAVRTRDVAEIASELTGRPIEVTEGAPGQPQATGSMFGYVAFERTSSDVEALTGRPATSVREMLEANRDVLLGAANPGEGAGS